MTFDFFVGVFAIFGTFAFMVILADYILPALFSNDNGDYLE
jgi:hypothetical protein